MVRYILIAAVVALALGCSNDPDRDLFGMWTGKMKDVDDAAPKYASVKLNLHSDHTYDKQTALTNEPTGKWSVSGDKLTLVGAETVIMDVSPDHKSLADQEMSYKKD
jgi:hypothetical protein